MKGHDNMPARVMEERVRDAFSVAAETVTAHDLPGLPTPADGSWATRGRRGPAPCAGRRADQRGVVNKARRQPAGPPRLGRQLPGSRGETM
jgi:hypothetical protein